MRTFIEAKPANTKTVETYSYPPFTTYKKFDIEKTSVKWDSDLKYVGGVLKALKKITRFHIKFEA